MKKLLQKGFTLIELLIVIGILGILVVAVLLTLNPAEAQRKARDAQRLKDMATLNAIMSQAIDDGLITAATWGGAALRSSISGVKDCSGGWLGTADLCNYASSIPVDPLNRATSTAGSTTTCAGTSADRGNRNAYYYVNWTAASNLYEINVRQESSTNCAKITSDGGNSFTAVEVGSDPALGLISAAN